MYAIPAQPAEPVNPAELPLAEAVLNTSQVDLIPAAHRPVLYRRLILGYNTLAEEFWALLFGPAIEVQTSCRVVQMAPEPGRNTKPSMMVIDHFAAGDNIS